MTKMREMLATPSPPPLEGVRSFLLDFVYDSDRELLGRQVRAMLNVNPTPIIDAVEAIEEVLQTPPPPGVLTEMVWREGNKSLSEETDEEASSWLRALAGDLRAWLGDYAPPPCRT
jgi:hypothetical protein